MISFTNAYVSNRIGVAPYDFSVVTMVCSLVLCSSTSDLRIVAVWMVEPSLGDLWSGGRLNIRTRFAPVVTMSIAADWMLSTTESMEMVKFWVNMLV